MDIGEVVVCVEPLLEALDQAAETESNVVPMVEIGVRDGSSVDGEEEPVAADPGSRHEHWGVFLVLGLVQPAAIVQDGRDVEGFTVVVEHAIRVDRQIAGIVCVGVVYADNYQASEERAKQDVDRDTEGDNKWVYVVRDDVPVEGRQRVEAQPFVHSRNGGQGEVLGCDPGNPVEEAEGGEDVVRKPEIQKHEGERCSEEAVLRNTEHLLQGARHGIIDL